MEKYDLCVIGGGPSGYAAAMRATDFGKKVLLIEKDKIGGAGLYNGAHSSKTMWEYSQKIAAIRSEIPDYKVTYAEVMSVVDASVFERKFQMNTHIKLMENEVQNRLFNHEKGVGSLLSKNEVKIEKNNDSKIVYADNILLATGSTPRKLPHIPIDENIIMTSDGLSNMKEFPKSLVILGAGVIGCEFATIYSNFGQTKVYLIDKGDRILPMEDEDIALTVTENLEKNGVVIHKNSSLKSMQIVDGMVEYELDYKDGTKETLRVEKALISVGRVANMDGLNLEKVGVELDERGAIKDFDTQTSVENIYVAGDLSADIALVNVGEREGRHAVVRMFNPPVKPLNYKNVSTIMFLNPEVASVGMSEQEAVQKKMSVKIAKIDYSCISRAIAMRKTNGFFKIIVSNDKEMKVLGMRAVGEHASSAIQAVAYLIHMNHGVEELALMIHPHPSIIEGIQEAMRMLLGKSIYKSAVFKDKLKCYINDCGNIEHLDTL